MKPLVDEIFWNTITGNIRNELIDLLVCEFVLLPIIFQTDIQKDAMSEN